MFLLCVRDLKQNACCRFCVLFVRLFPNPRREFLACLRVSVMATIGMNVLVVCIIIVPVL